MDTDVYISRFVCARAKKRALLAQIAACVLGEGCGNLRLRVFGSSANLFGAEGADLDMCVVGDGDSRQLPCSSEIMHRVGAALERAGCGNVSIRDTARVPIVLFDDPESGLACDVSAHNPLALRNTELLRAYASIDGRVRSLAYIVKKWAKARAINSPSDGTLSSYGYVLLVLYYLQAVARPPLLPSLQRIDSEWPRHRSAPRQRQPLAHPFDASRDVDLFFHEPTAASLRELRCVAQRNTQSVGQLMAGFFRHFAWDFDYRTKVVSARVARALPKHEKAELECWPLTPTRFSIEDPFETWYDVAHVLKYHKHQTIHLEFMRATHLVDAAALSAQHAASRGDHAFDGAALLDLLCEDVALDKPQQRQQPQQQEPQEQVSRESSRDGTQKNDQNGRL